MPPSDSVPLGNRPSIGPLPSSRGHWPKRQPDGDREERQADEVGYGDLPERLRLPSGGVPVQLWRADNDKLLPAPFYADVVRAALPAKPEFYAVPDAGHFDFIAPCVEPSAMPQIYDSAPGFGRTAYHVRFDKAVVRFFRAKLEG